MKFSQTLTTKILAGHKTQTRRPLKGDARELAFELLLDHDGHRAPRGECPICAGGRIPKLGAYYRAGRSYALQRPKLEQEWRADEKLRMDEGRGRPPVLTVARIAITDVRLDWAGALDFRAARAEGFRTTADFKRYWLGLYEQRWFIEPGHVTTPRVRTDPEVIARFDARYARRPVWVITFELEEPRPRYLAQRSELGYVSKTHDHRGRAVAVMDEEIVDEAGALELRAAEAVDEGTLAAFASDAHGARVDRAQQWQQERDLLTAENRMIAIRRAAQMKGINVSKEMRALQQLLHHATKTELSGDAQRKADEKVRRHLAAAESRVFPVPPSEAA